MNSTRCLHEDMRNTLIVELTNRSNQANYQSFDNDTLAGMGAVLASLCGRGKSGMIPRLKR